MYVNVIESNRLFLSYMNIIESNIARGAAPHLGCDVARGGEQWTAAPIGSLRGCKIDFLRKKSIF